MSRLISFRATLAALLLWPAALGAQAAPAPDSGAVAGVVERFHALIAAGDSLAAIALLSPDVVVLESGGAETLVEFRAHHLAADIAYAQAVRITRSPLRVTVRGDVAWASGTSTAEGEFRGRTLNQSGAELVVLTRAPEGWRIRAIHWSSRARR